MADKEDSIVAGFVFSDPGVARQAAEELKAMEYLAQQMDMNQPQAVLKAYCQMVERNLFSTQVGYCYLKKIQDYLMSVAQIPKAEIPAIPVVGAGTRDDGMREGRRADRGTDTRAKSDLRPLLARYRRRCGLLGMVSLILTVSIIGMFVIAATGDHPTILNYEEKLIDKYAAWEAELVEREAEVRRLEQQLR